MHHGPTPHQALMPPKSSAACAGVLLLAATNRPQEIDAALLRPGRFDVILYVPPPDEAGRLETLKIHTRGMPLAADADLQVCCVLKTWEIWGLGDKIVCGVLHSQAGHPVTGKERRRVGWRGGKSGEERCWLAAENSPRRSCLCTCHAAPPRKLYLHG